MARPLTQDAVRLINDYHQGGYSNAEIARALSVHPSTVSNVVNGKTHKPKAGRRRRDDLKPLVTVKVNTNPVAADGTTGPEIYQLKRSLNDAIGRLRDAEVRAETAEQRAERSIEAAKLREQGETDRRIDAERRVQELTDRLRDAEARLEAEVQRQSVPEERIESERLEPNVPEPQEDEPQAPEPPAIMAARERLDRAQRAFRESSTPAERDEAAREQNAAARELKELRRRDG